ncbi:hypothetical protein ABIB90_008478, partial [Bradyrhizobium sp. JR4.1]|uniref:hypothetical protein n=1 Tax=Bradyrhizobium sp. JR4.1 TaxID=3156372 RepID=UPI003391A575
NGARPDRADLRLTTFIATSKLLVLRRPFESAKYAGVAITAPFPAALLSKKSEPHGGRQRGQTQADRAERRLITRVKRCQSPWLQW